MMSSPEISDEEETSEVVVSDYEIDEEPDEEELISSDDDVEIDEPEEVVAIPIRQQFLETYFYPKYTASHKKNNEKTIVSSKKSTREQKNAIAKTEVRFCDIHPQGKYVILI